MFKLSLTKTYIDAYYKLIKNNPKIEKAINNTLEKLRNNPHLASLNSHKVVTKSGKVSWSSRVTGDIRIIWNYSYFEIKALTVLNVGGHSGKNKVYN